MLILVAVEQLGKVGFKVEKRGCLVTVTPWWISGGGVGNLSRIETSLGAIKWDAVE